MPGAAQVSDACLEGGQASLAIYRRRSPRTTPATSDGTGKITKCGWVLVTVSGPARDHEDLHVRATSAPRDQVGLLDGASLELTAAEQVLSLDDLRLA